MNPKACGYYILIEIPKKEAHEKSALYIPKDIEDAEIDSADTGIVRGIGPCAFSGVAAVGGKRGAEGAKEWGFAIGDTVEYTRYDGKKPSQEGYENYRYIQDQHIISKIEE